MQSSEVTSIPYAFLFGVDSRVSLRGQCSQLTIDSLRDVFSSFSAAWALETSQIAAIRTWRIDLLSIVRACFENGWRGPLARPGRRPADRSGRAPPCKQAVPIGSDRGSRSVRRVAGRHRRVACATRKRFSRHALTRCSRRREEADGPSVGTSPPPHVGGYGLRVIHSRSDKSRPGQRERRSFDNFRDDEQPASLGRGMAKRFLVWQRGADLVGTSHVYHRNGVGGRLDRADVDLAQLFDVAEHLAELRAELALFFRCETETGQVGDILHVNVRVRHGAKSRSPSGKFNPPLPASAAPVS